MVACVSDLRRGREEKNQCRMARFQVVEEAEEEEEEEESRLGCGYTVSGPSIDFD